MAGFTFLSDPTKYSNGTFTCKSFSLTLTEVWVRINWCRKFNRLWNWKGWLIPVVHAQYIFYLIVQVFTPHSHIHFFFLFLFILNTGPLEVASGSGVSIPRAASLWLFCWIWYICPIDLMQYLHVPEFRKIIYIADCIVHFSLFYWMDCFFKSLLFQ